MGASTFQSYTIQLAKELLWVAAADADLGAEAPWSNRFHSPTFPWNYFHHPQQRGREAVAHIVNTRTRRGQTLSGTAMNVENGCVTHAPNRTSSFCGIRHFDYLLSMVYIPSTCMYYTRIISLFLLLWYNFTVVIKWMWLDKIAHTHNWDVHNYYWSLLQNFIGI